jgi:endonuclease YncB( thermonuclease family)
MARARLQALINGRGKLELTEVRCSCLPGSEGTRFCNYGRACGTLKVRGVDVGRTLIAEGLARPYICSKYRCPRRQGWCGEAAPVPSRV